MCRSIHQLRRPDNPPSEQELQQAALQFVRKISGYRQPSRANRAAFDQAVLEIAAASRKMLAALVVPNSHRMGETKPDSNP